MESSSLLIMSDRSIAWLRTEARFCTILSTFPELRRASWTEESTALDKVGLRPPLKVLACYCADWRPLLSKLSSMFFGICICICTLDTFDSYDWIGCSAIL